MTLKIPDLISQYLTEEDKENANKFDSYTKLRGYVADNYIKQWALDHVYTEDIKEAHESGYFHIHDLSDGLVPYSYFGKTAILVRGADKQPFFLSLEKIQGRTDLEVFMGGWEWTKVVDTVTHTSHTDLLKIETDNGRILIVTEDHPMFRGFSKTTVPASDLKIKDPMCSALSFNRISFGNLILPPRLAWLLGMYIAEGCPHGKNFAICQYESPEREKIFSILRQFQIDYTVSKKDVFIDGDNLIIKDLFSSINRGAENKSLPPLAFCKETFFDIVSGMIDGDGWRTDYDGCASLFGIDSISYELTGQIKTLFDTIRLPASLRSYDNGSYSKIYKIKFHLTPKFLSLFRESIKVQREGLEFRKKKAFNFDYFSTMPKIKKIDRIPWKGKPVYDITTESEIFSAIGLKVHNCKGHDITKILIRGLKTQTVIAGPPKHLSSFFDQCVNLIAYNQQHWAGAMAIAHINTYAAPFIRKDWGHLRDENGNYPDEIYQIVKQAVQSFIFNLNFPSRAGSQTPFSNVIFNFKCPEILRDQDVVNAGCGGLYGDYDTEAYMILKAFNDVYNEGDAGGRPFTFPIPTLNLLPDTPFDDPLWFEIVETTIKFGTWSFFNYIGSGLDPNSILAMCCRLFNSYDEINGFLEEVAPAGGRWAYQGETGSIGVVTLNMGKLGHLANKSEPAFYKLLEDILDKARRALVMKGIFIEKFKDRFMPFDVEYGTDLRRFFRTIGVVGLNEMCVNLFGTPLSENKEFVIEVLDYLREWTKETQKATRVLWNVEMTPAEGCATRLAMIDKELYGDYIFTQGIEGAWYYTSMVTPPSQELSLIDRILVEQDILLKFSGGTIHRIFLGEQAPSVAATAKLIERIAKRTKVVYFDLASIYSICKKDGKQRRGNHPICEECGSEALVYERIVGYYRQITNANAGKYQEIIERSRVNLPTETFI